MLLAKDRILGETVSYFYKITKNTGLEVIFLYPEYAIDLKYKLDMNWFASLDEYRIGLNATPGFYFSFRVFDPRLPYKKRIEIFF